MFGHNWTFDATGRHHDGTGSVLKVTRRSFGTITFLDLENTHTLDVRVLKERIMQGFAKDLAMGLDACGTYDVAFFG